MLLYHWTSTSFKQYFWLAALPRWLQAVCMFAWVLIDGERRLGGTWKPGKAWTILDELSHSHMKRNRQGEKKPGRTLVLASYLTWSDRWRTFKGNNTLWLIVYLFLILWAVNSPIYGSHIFTPIVHLSLKGAILLSSWMSNSHSSVNLLSGCWENELRFIYFNLFLALEGESKGAGVLWGS